MKNRNQTPEPSKMSNRKQKTGYETTAVIELIMSDFVPVLPSAYMCCLYCMYNVKSPMAINGDREREGEAVLSLVHTWKDAHRSENFHVVISIKSRQGWRGASRAIVDASSLNRPISRIRPSSPSSISQGNRLFSSSSRLSGTEKQA